MQIKNYKIQDIIGEGGMATVYLGEQIILERLVALKVMSDHLAADKRFQKIFFIEAKIVAKLEHPNIIRIYDFGTTDNDISFMAMEYLSGGSLKEKLDSGCLSFAESLQIIEEVGAGLEYSHKSNFIHRDIKPANILFRNDGTAVISDFGIAKLQDTIGDLTRIGYTMGTAEYMSPEQARTTQLDQRSDVYCLGLVFYEMLTGKKAFKSDTAAQAIYQHTTAPQPNLPDNYRYLQEVINKVLAKSPNSRYSSVSEFISAVKDADTRKNDIKTQIYNIPSNEQKISTKKASNVNYFSKKKGIIITVLTSISLIGSSLWLYQSKNSIFQNFYPLISKQQDNPATQTHSQDTANKLNQTSINYQDTSIKQQGIQTNITTDQQAIDKTVAQKQEAARIAAEKQQQEATRIATEKKQQEAAKIAAQKKSEQDKEAAKIAAEKKAQREKEAAKIAAQKKAQREKEAAKIAAEKKAQREKEAAKIASEKQAARIAAEKKSQREKEKQAARIAAEKKAQREKEKKAARIAAQKKAQREKEKQAARVAAEKKAQREKEKKAARVAAEKKAQREKEKKAARIAAEKKAQREKEAARIAAEKKAQREKEAARIAAQKKANEEARKRKAAEAKQRANEEAARQRAAAQAAAKKKASNNSTQDDLSDRLCTIDCD